MQLKPKPIRFNTRADLSTLLLSLNDKEIDADKLADYLILSKEGNTYLLHDLLNNSGLDEGALPTFMTKQGSELSVKDIEYIINNKSSRSINDLVHNKSLAIMLTTKRPPSISALSFFSIVFPLISYQENSYEENAIRDYLEYCRKNNLNEKDPFTDAPLRHDQLVRNHALEQLIWLDIKAAIEFVKKYLDHEVDDRLTARLAARRIKKYELSLVEKKIDISNKREVFLKTKEEIDKLLQENLNLKQMSVSELELLRDVYMHKKNVALAIHEKLTWSYENIFMNIMMLYVKFIFPPVLIATLIYVVFAVFNRLPLVYGMYSALSGFGGAAFLIISALFLSTSAEFLQKLVEKYEQKETLINNFISLLNDSKYLGELLPKNEKKMDEIDFRLNEIYKLACYREEPEFLVLFKNGWVESISFNRESKPLTYEDETADAKDTQDNIDLPLSNHTVVNSFFKKSWNSLFAVAKDQHNLSEKLLTEKEVDDTESEVDDLETGRFFIDNT